MRTKALAKRILLQIKNDKRTVGLILVAPLIILTLAYFIFKVDSGSLVVAISNPSESLKSTISKSSEISIVLEEMNRSDGIEAVKNEKAIMYVDLESTTPKVYVDGSKSGDAKSALAMFKVAYAMSLVPSIPGFEPGDLTKATLETQFVYGSERDSLFDVVGPPLVGIIIFFFVFLIAGINFLTERTSGTLEKLMSTPIHRMEIISGYTIGFGILAVIQALVITLFMVYVLGLDIRGSILYIVLINLLTTISALTLGVLLSSLATSEFQMMQFIPLVISPQVFLCGIFKLNAGFTFVSKFLPLTYTTNALSEVMQKGHGIQYIYTDLLVLLGFAVLFMVLNSFMMKKIRPI